MQGRDSVSVEVLLVEDDPGDVELTREAFEESKIPVNLHVVGDGEQAMDFLLRRDGYESAPLPDLMLIDLNMPRMDGRELLRKIKSHDKMRMIPVVILTTSDAAEDVTMTYGIGANSFITKPMGLQEFVNTVQAIEDFWFSVVKLPTRAQPLA